MATSRDPAQTVSLRKPTDTAPATDGSARKKSAHPRLLEHAETLPDAPSTTIVPTERLSHDSTHDVLSVLSRLIADGDHKLAPRFAIGEQLGQGGMGTVMQAKQRALYRDVVIKRLRDDKRSPQATAELLREAWITGALEHPSVVPVYDLGIDSDGQPAIVFKRIEGVTWSVLMQDPDEVDRRFGSRDLLEWNLRILMQVINAIRFAHSRGIIHRDIKPDNVMIGEFGEVYVVDWGIALSLRPEESGRLPHVSRATSMAGTPCYMAPEMLGDNAPKLSERTDIYLLGAVLYELITGDPPHLGKSSIDVLASVLDSEPALPASMPSGLAAICRRAMAPDPDERYQDAADMHRALQEFLEHRGSEALARQAESWLDDLHQLWEQARREDTDPSGQDYHQQLYKHYGACRFGFLEALSAWRDNPIARRGLKAATETMIEYELEHGDARAAAVLKADIADTLELSPELCERVDAALAAKAADMVRLAELERLGHELDIRIGARARAWGTLLMGISWVLLPLYVAWFRPISDVFPSNARMSLWSLGSFASYLMVLYVARKPMLQSAINRRLVTLVGVMLAGQAVLHLGAEVAGIAPLSAQILNFFMWFGVITVISIAIERRMLPSGIAYLAAFFAAALLPQQRFLIIAIANSIILINALVIWMPRNQGAGGHHPALPRRAPLEE
ncbi:MAG: hypothetical protein Tsb0020_37540 [Haliangiales bacterium]